MSKAEPKQTAEMLQLYYDGYSYQQIGEAFTLSRQAVWERLSRAGVVSRKPKKLPFVMYDGMKWTIAKSHGYYRNTARTGGELLLHRYKYEREVGSVPVDWDVHHIDGDKLNNNIDNLTAMSKSDHTKLHSVGHNQYKNNKTIAEGKYEAN